MTRNPPHVPDHVLWDDVKRTIQPISTSGTGGMKSWRAPGLPIQIIPAALRSSSPRQSIRHDPPPLATFDRRTAQKLSRGQLEPDSLIDLHGESVETARMRLYHFLQSRQHQGNRLVLVITGKGASPFARHTLHSRDVFHTPERDGRLRREVPLWLHEALFRAHVVGYQPAHPRHGGGGAFYVKLRRTRGEI